MTEIKPNYDTKRQRLADIVPLDHPFTIYIEQTKFCNFKCYYCMHATHDNPQGTFAQNGHEMQHMDFKLYQKLIKELGELGIKRIVFSGLGEPLMNPDFAKFVKYAVEADIAERVEVLTNGVLLTPQYSDALIEAGITNINISVQGIDAAAYQKVCGVKIDFDGFIKNLEYLYQHKKQTQIYIKCIDAILKTEHDRNTFFDIFGKVADRIFIEHLVVMQQSMENLPTLVDASKNLYGEPVDQDRQICTQCFYFLQAGCDGNMYPCSIPGLSKDFSIGNLHKNTLKEIWNGSKRKRHLRTMLEFRRETIEQCKNCSCFNAIIDPLEKLDMDAERLLQYFQE